MGHSPDSAHRPGAHVRAPAPADPIGYFLMAGAYRRGGARVRHHGKRRGVGGAGHGRAPTSGGRSASSPRWTSGRQSGGRMCSCPAGRSATSSRSWTQRTGATPSPSSPNVSSARRSDGSRRTSRPRPTTSAGTTCRAPPWNIARSSTSCPIVSVQPYLRLARILLDMEQPGDVERILRASLARRADHPRVPRARRPRIPYKPSRGSGQVLRADIHFSRSLPPSRSRTARSSPFRMSARACPRRPRTHHEGSGAEA